MFWSLRLCQILSTGYLISTLWRSHKEGPVIDCLCCKVRRWSDLSSSWAGLQPKQCGSSPVAPVVSLLASVHRHFWILHSLFSSYYRHHGYLYRDHILEGSCILYWNQVLKSTLGPKLPLKNPSSLIKHDTFSSRAGPYLFIHSFVCWWTFRLFPPFVNYK